MALIYRGNVKSLEDQVHQYKDTLNQRYREVLGDEYYEKISREAQKLLVPECFLNTIEELNKFAAKIPASTPSKFLTLTDSSFSLDPDGRIKERKARAGVGFYINDESFRNSGSSHFTDKIIASYVHEYDHFVIGVLQKSPLYLLRNAFTQALGYSTQLENLIEYALKIEKEDSPENERKNKILLMMQADLMEEMYEKATRILDKLILGCIGINVPLDFRNEERLYQSYSFEDLDMDIYIPFQGDPFKDIDDRESVHRAINWEEYLNQLTRRDYIDNFYNSLKNIGLELLPLPELKRRNAKEKEKFKQSKEFKKMQELKKKLKKREKRK